MSHPIRLAILRILGFILSILLAFSGVLLMRRDDLLVGGILLVVGLVLLFLSIRSIEKNPLTDEEVQLLTPYLFPVLLFLLTLVSTILVVLNVSDYLRTIEKNHWAVAEWLISMLSLVAGVLWLLRWKPARPRAILDWIQSNRVEFILLVLILLAGLAARTIALTRHPYPWSGDEASIGMEARRLINGSNTDLFNTGWSGQPNVSFLPTLLNMLIFGQNILAIKLTSAITGTLSILALYLLGREWFGREVALIAAGFLAAFPFHLQFSRVGVDNIVDSLMVSLVLWLIFRAVRTRSLPSYLLAGMATGLTLYTYVGTRLVLAIAIGALGYICLKQKGYFKASLHLLGTYLAGLLVTVAPMATFFLKHRDLFMTRIGQEGIFLNGWLPKQVELTGQTTGQILLNQFSRTVLVFFAQNANNNFLNFNRPYLTILGAIFFLIGISVSFRHLFDERYFVLQAWFWSVLTLGGFLTLNPPANTRLVMTTPATALFIAIGAWRVSRVLLQLKLSPRLVQSLGVLLVIILGVQNLTFYFGSYWKGYYWQDANGELAMEAGLEMQKLGTGYDYYLFGLPRVFAAFPTTDFLNPDVQKIDLKAESIPGLTFPVGRGALIVAIPENETLLQQVMQRFPGGAWESIPRKVKSEVLYYAYLLTPQQANSP